MVISRGYHGGTNHKPPIKQIQTAKVTSYGVKLRESKKRATYSSNFTVKKQWNLAMKVETGSSSRYSNIGNFFNLNFINFFYNFFLIFFFQKLQNPL